MGKFVASTFLIPHICFSCRLSFKRVQQNIAGEVLCPNCKKPARMMARKFQAPPRTDIQGWEVVRLLYQNGWRGYGWNVKPQMSLRAAEDYLKRKAERERNAPTEIKQARQNERWQQLRKKTAYLVRHKSSTRKKD